MPRKPMLSAFFLKCDRCRMPFGMWRGRSCPWCGGLASGPAPVVPPRPVMPPSLVFA